jgi:acyl carrier protein
LEFLGRADQQVKIGGHRLELGEVEAALESHPAVRHAVVLATGDRGALRLHGFVQLGPHASGSSASPDELAAHLAERLPGHAIPGRLTVLDALPLTANGKLDRAALATTAASAPALDGAAPNGAVEQRLAGLWSEVLGTTVRDRHANFFTAGGTSLLAIRLVTAVRRDFDLAISTRAFLSAPTIAALGAEIDRAGAARANSAFENGVI